MKIETMRSKSTTELFKESAKKRAKLAGLRKDLLVNEIKDNSQIGKLRKDIARIETLRREKENAKGEKQ